MGVVISPRCCLPAAPALGNPERKENELVAELPLGPTSIKENLSPFGPYSLITQTEERVFRMVCASD